MLPFLYPLKTPENQKFFWCFQGVKNGNIRQNWVKFGEDVSISEKFGSVPHLDESFIITNRKKKCLNLSTSSWKYQHDSRNHIHIAERRYIKTLIFKYIYSYLMEYFFQIGFNSSKLFPAVKTSYCISFIKPFVT